MNQIKNKINNFMEMDKLFIRPKNFQAFKMKYTCFL